MSKAVNHCAYNIVSQDKQTIIVIGAGPVGVRFVEELSRKGAEVRLLLFGNEPYSELYNRVQLSQVLSRDKDYEDIITELPLSNEKFQLTYHQQHIQSILPEKNQVISHRGDRFDYDQLVLATGSKPYVPSIEGNDLTGVYTFRNMRDTEALLARIYRARKIIIVGGGLLGLEAAKALKKYQTEVVLYQQSDRLMNRQLDEKASKLLREHVTGQGITIITDSAIRKIIGYPRVSAVVTRDNEVVDCDTVLFCTGIKPEIQLALNAGIKVSRGVSVNDQLQTSNPNIYAIGECCEHDGQVYGIVSPGFEQASVLANRLTGGQASYQGTQLISTLKVVDQSVCSMGEVAEVARRPKQHFLTYADKKTKRYRKLVIHQNRIIGACAFGEWEESRRIQETFLAKTKVYPWHQLWFLFTGRLWISSNDQSVVYWPEATIVCQCNQVSRGRISQAIIEGCTNIKTIGVQTGAGEVCGSCQPLLQNLIGCNTKPIPIFGAISVLMMSVIAILVTLFFILFPGVTAVDTVQKPSLEFLWNDNFWKQTTGFTMLVIITLGLVMSLRKRFEWVFLGQFSYWRLVHVILGALALVILLAHTGAHLGENLNRLLMINFLLVSAVGAFAGITMSLASKTSTTSLQFLKKSWFWAHLLVVWPLPALLAIHILSVYYF